MPQFHQFPLMEQQTQYIETEESIIRMFRRVSLGHLLNGCLFPFADRFFREISGQTAAGFYFAENQNISIQKNDIYLLVLKPEIRFEHTTTFFTEKFNRSRLADFSKMVMYGQDR